MSGNKCIVKIYGGLGNQLFQIATGLAYCQETGKELVLFPCDTNRRTYYWDSLLSNFADKITHYLPNIPIYKEIGFSYRKIPHYDGDIILDGYFQSSKYFSNDKLLNNQITWPHNKIEINDKTVIVHARRGDYLANEWNILIHGPLPPSYYKLAIELMKKQIPDAQFILISDDNTFWSGPDFDFLRQEKTKIFDGSDIDTLTLMKNCHNFIIANSTFSWWGTYLANAINVIAPSQWFGPRGPQDWQDIYEDSWTIIPIS